MKKATVFLSLFCLLTGYVLADTRPFPEGYDPDYIPPLAQSVKKITQSPLTLPFLDDMESGENGWTSTGFFNLINNPHEIQILSPTINPNLVTLPDEGYLPHAHSGNATWWYGEPETGTFIGSDFDLSQSDKSGGESQSANTGSLISPVLAFPADQNIILSFWTWWEIEGVDVDLFDMMYVEISIDGGLSFSTISALNPINDVDGESFIPYTSQGLGLVGKWQKQVYSLDEYAGNDAIIRFRFDSVDNLYNGFRGWFIDDVYVYTAESSEAPVINSVSPSAGIPESIIKVIGNNFMSGAQGKIGDLTAETVVMGNTEISMKVPQLTPGTYDITVTNTDGQSVTYTDGFTVTTKLPPSVTSISPNEAYEHISVEVTISGSNFDNDAVAYIDEYTLIDQINLTSSSITGNVPAILSVGSHNVRVINSDEQYGLLVNSFTVLVDPGTSQFSINSITDVPNDQGKKVSISWNAHGNDTAGTTETVITSYSIWRKIDKNLPSVWKVATPDGDWHFVKEVPAVQDEVYFTVVPTLADSTINNGLYLSTFFIRAHTSDPKVHYETDPTSGFSVDNLCPCPVTKIALSKSAEGTYISWDDCPDEDFSYYAVYKGTSTDFVANESSLIGTTLENNLLDDSDAQNDIYYKIATYDFSGNRGISENPLIAGVHEQKPLVFQVRAPYPNPFNPAVTIEYIIPEASQVSVIIYNILGREEAVLQDGVAGPGVHRVSWNGRNKNGQLLGSGTYLYKIIAGEYSSQGKVMFLR